jgi:hypothetical protein
MSTNKKGRQITIKVNSTSITVVANTSSKLRVSVEGTPSGQANNKFR